MSTIKTILLASWLIMAFTIAKGQSDSAITANSFRDLLKSGIIHIDSITSFRLQLDDRKNCIVGILLRLDNSGCPYQLTFRKPLSLHGNRYKYYLGNDIRYIKQKFKRREIIHFNKLC